MTGLVAGLRPRDIEIGQSARFEHRVTDDDLDRYAALTGDISPLHMDAHFARSRGFRGRVAHGTFLAGLVSRLFGVHLPGRDCVLHSMSVKWVAPACVGDRVVVVATVTQISVEAAAMAAELTITLAETGAVLAKGKVQAGFTGSD
ncbi:MAG: MaoC/PaaZ C-terminal domain-containing protein [Phaeospirillum sp.]|nr:MaoC/PaaZ C-terminal domain-containing protein [Phaeospirillum sp.]